MIEQNKPAFPVTFDAHHDGITARGYAAIALKVPSSGTDWLDEMIKQSLLNEFAAKALQAMKTLNSSSSDERLSIRAYQIAREMLFAMESKGSHSQISDWDLQQYNQAASMAHNTKEQA